MNVEVLNNQSIVGSGTSNSNSAMQLGSGVDTPSNATMNATIVGNTIRNTNGNSGDFLRPAALHSRNAV